ncbi:hypothetical protein [Kitasatospora xanthocidica]|uniref:hypothetical protein n=1 Tax=Kitasatospora xanthocidica TaxID=83382 RepID=UPI0011C49C9D|nr:hypothetical protein [Kitasatospora xanthocidica]
MAYPPAFTIAYLVHSDVELLRRTIPATLDALCRGTRHPYDLVLVVDGAESAPIDEITELAHTTWGFDEIRLRWRTRHRASGDQANNIHTHFVTDKTRFLITIEGDVVVFRAPDATDVLAEIADTFDQCPQLTLAQRIDDHDCWQWKLEDTGPALSAKARSVNRVSSHFLIYDTHRARPAMAAAGGIPGNRFHDDGQSWMNYEDWISHTFAHPAGSGIGYLHQLPLRIFHCDEKTTPGSAHYRRDLETRLRVFAEREHQVKEEFRA